MKKWFLLLFCSVVFFVVNAQQGNYNHFLARQFVENNEFAKAAEYYDELYNQEDGLQYYQEYIDVLYKLNNTELIEKIIKLSYKRSGNDVTYLIDLVAFYQKQNKSSDAEKQIEKVIKDLTANPLLITTVANKFIQLKLYDEAFRCYTKGKELLKDKNAFNLDIANIYLLKNELNAMVQTYLDEAPLHGNNLVEIESGLLKAMVSEEAKDYIEKSLLQRVNKDKTMLVYQDLLVWLYMHRNDFDGAIIQAKSLDLFRYEDGSNVIKIANAATQQKDYDAAIKGYQYVVDKGNKNTWFVTANLSLINTKRDKLVNTTQYTQEQLQSLKETYVNFISNYKDNYTAIDATIELAQLEALYLHQPEDAITHIEPIIEDNRLNKELLAKAKLNLGDYYIMIANPWDARLIYTQVEKEMKGTPLGEEAKFRNARLSYFKGDFEWSQTQLNIIKANTSELISNDAIDLSVFILDNLNTDETDLSLLKYAKADLLRFQNKPIEANDSLDYLIQNFNGTSLLDDIYYMKYKIARSQQNYTLAAAYLSEIEKKYSEDLLGDNAIFYLGELYEKFLNDEEKAKSYYERIIIDYHDSTFSIEARKRYRKLRGDS